VILVVEWQVLPRFGAGDELGESSVGLIDGAAGGDR
jgi:hypothetical protein